MKRYRDSVIYYREVAHIDLDYADECPTMLEKHPDYDVILKFIVSKADRFGDMYPSEELEYYQLKGDWVAGNGLLDLYKDNTKDGIIYRLYRRE